MVIAELDMIAGVSLMEGRLVTIRLMMRLIMRLEKKVKKYLSLKICLKNCLSLKNGKIRFF